MTLKQLINPDLLTFSALCEKIRNGEHFSLARYGDGEFDAILGKKGANCDGHEYFPEMGKDLANVLRSDPAYYIGLHSTSRNGLDVKTLDWLKENKLTEREYIPNEIFHIPLRDGLFDQFWEALIKKDLIVLGPKYLLTQKIIPACHTTLLPEINTYLSLSKIINSLSYTDFAGAIVLIAASMTAPLIVDHLHQQYGNTATFIDFGSCFDPYCRIKSRSFHKPQMPQTNEIK